jgi:hypothetical protein
MLLLHTLKNADTRSLSLGKAVQAWLQQLCTGGGAGQVPMLHLMDEQGRQPHLPENTKNNERLDAGQVMFSISYFLIINCNTTSNLHLHDTG